MSRNQGRGPRTSVSPVRAERAASFADPVGPHRLRSHRSFLTGSARSPLRWVSERAASPPPLIFPSGLSGARTDCAERGQLSITTRKCEHAYHTVGLTEGPLQFARRA